MVQANLLTLSGTVRLFEGRRVRSIQYTSSIYLYILGFPGATRGGSFFFRVLAAFFLDMTWYHMIMPGRRSSRGNFIKYIAVGEWRFGADSFDGK